MIEQLVPRPVQILGLPLPTDAAVLRPEQVIIRFNNRATVDLGALCYLTRDFSGAYRRGVDGKHVALSTLSYSRIEQVRRLISFVDCDLRQSGRRTETTRDQVSRFVAFMAWADANSHQGVIANPDAAKAAVRSYFDFIRERVRCNEISLNSGARQQVVVSQLLGEFMEIEDLTCGLNFLRKCKRSEQSTRPPSEDAQARALSLAEALFSGLCALVLDDKPYPHAVAMPKYLGLPNDQLWLFPTNSWFLSPDKLANRESLQVPCWGYNYDEGRTITLGELRKINNFAGDCDNRRRHMLRRTSNRMADANKNQQHTKRRHSALQAANMFSIQFFAQTGMNWAQMIQLTWADDYEVVAAHQVFRTIKWRAGGKLVSFELPVAFMPTFKRYLTLRAYLLNGQSCDLLFFKSGTQPLSLPEKIRGRGLNSVYNTLRRIDPTLPTVHPREWRAAKSDWLVRNTDPATAALVLQNTEKTVLASYAEGSETVHLEEMSSFLSQVSTLVVDRGVPVAGSLDRAVGMCVSFGDPGPAHGVIKPDCKGPEGCLFCDKFKVHADEKDTRKLFSCRYVLRQTAPMMGSEERLQGLLGPFFERIQTIIAEVAQRDSTMVAKIAAEVDDDGELDPYWARKLEMLMALGVVV